MPRLGLRSIGCGFLKIIAGFNACGSFCIFLILVFVTGDVAGRVFFNRPITGIPEIVKVAVVGITFMQIPWALWTNRHIRSDLIAGRLGSRGRGVLALIRNIIATAAFICIFIANWHPMMKAWEILEYEGGGAMPVPVYPVFTLIQIGSALAATISLSRIVVNIRNLTTS